ncbi:hypothetical protein [uncultured Sunxiuqinia sp.]|uniref:hypothetical protein n=1 Tax=uncultured Sunxiuqinia sp. TaxID=1573825 RepID=UPI002611B382|nr:hypothetical protein [uncultured Sunxiuqinia sp.]
MKKFFTLFSVLIFLGMSANVLAQDATHYPGEVHTFRVDDHGAAASYAWEVYTDATLKTAVGSNSNANYIISGEGTHEVTITWTNIAPTTYYVGVTETIGNCSTSRYTSVAINAASYDLVVVNEDASENVIDLETCMEGAGRIFNMSEAITPLDNVVYFTVSLENEGSLFNPQDGWAFDYILTVKDAADVTKTATVVVVGTPTEVSGISTTGSGTISVDGLNKFTIAVTVADNPGTSSSDDLLVQFVGTNLEVGAGKITETDSKGNAINYTRNTYPNTSAITVD